MQLKNRYNDCHLCFGLSSIKSDCSDCVFSEGECVSFIVDNEMFTFALEDDFIKLCYVLVLSNQNYPVIF